MNPNVRTYIQRYVDPNKESIKGRSFFLDVNIPVDLPNFIVKRAEDIKLLTLIGSDSTVMKLLPNFLEELLLNMLVSRKTNDRSEFYSNQRKFETMNVKAVYSELKELKILPQDAIIFCDSYFGQRNIRNNEIHNKEGRIFEELGGLELIDPDTGERKTADEAVVRLIKSSPELLRILNHNDRVSRVEIEVLGLFGFIVSIKETLYKLNNIPDKNTEEFLSNQPKSKKFKMIINSKQKGKIAETAIKENPNILNYNKLTADTFELDYNVEQTASEASKYFLPRTNGEFSMIPL